MFIQKEMFEESSPEMNLAKIFLLSVLLGGSLAITGACIWNIRALQAMSIPDPQTESKIGTATLINAVVLSLVFGFDFGLGFTILMEYKKKPEVKT
jgi:hypothetical protein